MASGVCRLKYISEARLPLAHDSQLARVHVRSPRWLISANPVTYGHCRFRKLLDRQLACGLARRLLYQTAEVENAKRITDDFGGGVVDTGAVERFGRRTRIRNSGSPVLLRGLVQPVLGTLLGSIRWLLLAS